MKKQAYLQPTMTVVKVHQKTMLLEASQTVNAVSGNADLSISSTGSSDAARVKDYSVWDDDWND